MFTRYPGKLFLMGEFSIMYPGSTAVVSAVDHYLNITIEDAEDYEIKSSHGHLKGNDIFENKLMPHVQSCLKVMNDLVDYKPFKMTIESELEIDGKKIGFGSSGVIVVGVLDSVLKFHGIKLNNLELFKLACLVQLDMDEFSSGGDLAATVYQQTVIYQRYDYYWLLEQDFNVKDLIKMDWPLLSIKTLDVSSSFDIAIGWTGTPHATNGALQKMREQSLEDQNFIKDWVLKANETTKEFIKSVHLNDFKLIEKSVVEYKQLMKILEEWMGSEMETPKLKILNESSKYPSKISGSGGGDCGIVFVPIGAPLDCIETWNDNGIKLIEGGIIHEH